MFTRYAVYYVPPEGDFATFGARWLGWDIHHGQPVTQPDISGVQEATETPRKYGFHGTLKPPFRLAEGKNAQDLHNAVRTLAGQLKPARSAGLSITRMGRFLALVPAGHMGDLARVADACVMELDTFRAPATEAELAKRRKANLTPAQDALLVQWGYPYVRDAFRFHMTLTGRLPKETLDQWAQHAAAEMPRPEDPFVLDAVALVGERSDGQFELIERFPLTGV